MPAGRLTAPQRRAARVLCCLVAARETCVTERYLSWAARLSRRLLHEAIRDLRAEGFAVLRERRHGYLLIDMPAPEG